MFVMLLAITFYEIILWNRWLRPVLAVVLGQDMNSNFLWASSNSWMEENSCLVESQTHTHTRTQRETQMDSLRSWSSRGQKVPLTVSLCLSLRVWREVLFLSNICQLTKFILILYLGMKSSVKAMISFSKWDLPHFHFLYTFWLQIKGSSGK